eukprot:gnl/MRDRNA2_/MRDRNA2_91369_c0_seq1.p1 gnl/MRDRNA2_/MRDRNA2_91369_c0~~gnl/MRDRNA2_/MRDRNA2_91369_c0_seq1.p1  ORF type:complete len:375 (+),score=28.58 gnl/MRDRNA2_/MRDRNA2_91369_c0_seq1:87-1127(+)
MAPVNLGNDPFLSHSQKQSRKQPQRNQSATTGKYHHSHLRHDSYNAYGDCCQGVLLILVPLFVFILITCLFLYAHHVVPNLTWFTVFSTFLCSGGLCAMALYGTRDIGWCFVLGTSCGVACILAIWWGSTGYQWYMREFWWMEIGRHYTELNATTSAQSRSDASWLHFHLGSHVDTTKTVGYRGAGRGAGAVYCVAPVLSANQLTRVEYWAIGKDCCQKRSGFTCDEAGNPGAQSAVAMLGQDFIDQDFYQRAIRQAESAYKLASAEGAMLVHWVSDPKSIRDGLLWQGGALLLMGAAMELVIGIILACAMPRPHGQGPYYGNRNLQRSTKDPFATSNQEGYGNYL